MRSNGPFTRWIQFSFTFFIAIVFIAPVDCSAQQRSVAKGGGDARDILDSSEWKQLDRTVDNGLAYIATQQRQDGSFNGPDTGQPGITSLCILAFLSRGHLPNQGPYGKQLNRAIDYVLTKQRGDGLLFDMPIGNWSYGSPTHTAIYNHAIAGLMLGEVYGMSEPRRQELIRASIERAVRFTLGHQSKFRRHQVERGGWRYIRLSNHNSDADLSISAWQLLFLRSAKNAEFDVPKERIDEAVGFVRRCFDPARGSFTYCIVSGRELTPAMAGAGVVSLAMGGEHQSEIAQTAGRHVLGLRFDRYRGLTRYHYSAYYCSQAMFQLGGEYWAKFFPRLKEALINNQHPDGSWDRESSHDGHYGNTYTSALTILALTPPYQILPIYQR